MASPNFLWARHMYLPFTVIVVLSAPLIWAQSCYDGILPSLTSFEPPDTPSTRPLFTSPTSEPSPPPPQVLRLRLRDVTVASVDGYAYHGCIIDDSSNRVLGAARIDNNNMAPTLCRNLCAALSYSIFGVEYRTECYCGSTLATQAVTMAPTADCSLSCNGNPAVDCGAWSRINVYSATIPLSAVTGPGTATASSTVVATTTASPTTIPSSFPSPSTQAPISKGAVAGIGVGSALGAVLICAVVYYLWFHRRHQTSRRVSDEATPSAGQRPPMSDHGGAGERGHEAVMAKRQWAISEDPSSIPVELGEYSGRRSPVEVLGDYRQVHDPAEGR